MALMCLCAEFAREHGAEICALIVDHGLRSGSGREAKQARDWCAGVGLEAKILAWRGTKPASGVQAAARNARYWLLARAANEGGYGSILTAHSADDQAETVAMRRARSINEAGLVGMKDAIFIAAGAREPVKLLRPLLSFTREQTTATVKHYGQDYIDDPSNEDAAFERIRMRKKISSAQPGSSDCRLTLLKIAKTAGERMASCRQEEEAIFKSLDGTFTQWGGAFLSLTQLESTGISAFPAALTVRLIRAVSGADHAPSLKAGEAAAKGALETGTAVLGGTLIKRVRNRLWFVREPGAILGRANIPALEPVMVPAGASILWDSRFIITASGGAPVTVKPLGRKPVTSLGSKKGRFEGPREGLMSLPALYSGDDLIGAPGILFPSLKLTVVRSLVAERFNVDIIRFSEV